MSGAETRIIDVILDQLDAETKDLQAGRFHRLAEFAERKSRLVQHLTKARIEPESSPELAERLHSLRSVLAANLRAGAENAQALRELIALQLCVEQESEVDGTYGFKARKPSAG